MYKIILPFLLFALSTKSYEQQRQIDSLQKLLFTSKEDTNQVIQYVSVSDECRPDNPGKSTG
jgi:hypothetical protein